MSTITTLGPVGFNPTGNYDSTRQYEKLDVVYYQGSSYVSIANSIGQTPSDNSEYWLRLVAGGLGYDDIVDNLTSTISDKVLSAKQGKILKDLVDNNSNNISSEITARQNADANLQSQITSIGSGSPLVASSTSEMTDTTKTYVNTTDGYWYYYDGDSWEQGGVYQATQVNNEENIQNRIKENVTYQEITNYTDYIATYMKNDGTTAASTSISCLILDVKPNDKINLNYTIDNSLTIYSYILLLNNTVVTTVDKMNTLASNTYQKTVLIPSGVNKIAINYKNTYEKSVKFLNIIDGVDIKNKDEILLDILAPLEPITPDATDNAYITVNKSNKTITFNTNENFIYKKYDISNLNDIILKYNNYTEATIYAIIITDESNNVLFIDNYCANLNNEDIIKRIYNVTNGKYLYIQNKTNRILDIYNRNYTSAITKEKYTNFAIENLERRCTNLENQNPFQWAAFDKTYFCFVIDDCNSYLPKAAEIFHTNNIPLSSATIVSKLNNVYTHYTPSNTKTVKEILQDMVDDGGEVLAHYTGNLAPAGTPDTQSTHYLTTEKDWLERTRDVKMVLEENGFDVRGIITADSTKTRTSTGQKYCSLYFDYSDTLGTSPNFYLGRRKFFLSNDMQTMTQAKAYIDECCQTPGFYPFCFHGTRQDEPLINENDLTELLTYINNKGSNVCVCTTYSNVINMFGSTNLNERLKSLE